MASHEYAHCDNCMWFKDKNSKGIGKCTNTEVEGTDANKKSWCVEHIDTNPLDARYMSIEYHLRTTHALQSMNGHKCKPIEDVLKLFKWDRITRLRYKWPEEELAELLINHAETGRDRDLDYPDVKEAEVIETLETIIDANAAM